VRLKDKNRTELKVHEIWFMLLKNAWACTN